MTQTEIQLETLLSKLKRLDNTRLIQRVSDFVDGIFAAEQEHDWWDDLTEQDKADLKESIADGEAGREKSMEDVFNKYGI
jgi:hypothetical protein